MRARLVSMLNASQRPAIWAAVAGACRVARVVSRRKVRWSVRRGYALERAGRPDEARSAYEAAGAQVSVGPALPAGASRTEDPDAADEPSVPDDVDEPSVPDDVDEIDEPAVDDLARLRRRARSLARREQRLRRARRRRRRRRLFRRRGRVVPVLTRAHHRRWSQAPSTDWAAALHLLYLRHRDRYLPGYYAELESQRLPRSQLARAWRWYVEDVLVESVRLLRLNGRAVQRATGVPVRRQLRELLRLSTSMPSMPENYYKYELYRPENRARAHDYLHGHETWPVFYRALGEIEGIRELAPLDQDKLAFANRAQAHGVMVAPTLAVIEHGEVVRTAGELPAADLFVKPLAGTRGRGSRRWSYVAEEDGFRTNGRRADIPRASFLETLAAQQGDRSFIVQPCLVNHPDLADLALDALATCRVVTILDEAGEPEPVISIFRMPATPDTVVDNMHRGGVAAPVDISSGVMGPASDYALDGPAIRHSYHPATGGHIEGRPLPGWQEVLALARHAHRSFCPRVLVGWDISIGPDGPVLIEGNERPGVGGLQRLHSPLGTHRFGELLAFHMISRLEEQPAGSGPTPTPGPRASDAGAIMRR